MSSPSAGIGNCPDCGERVLFALAVTGDLIALGNGSDGPAAVRWDITGTPRVRHVEPGYRPREGEHRFRLHARSCPALAPVVAITAAPSLRPASRPVTGRRHASAR
jgi:hypothetical protein